MILMLCRLILTLTNDDYDDSVSDKLVFAELMEEDTAQALSSTHNSLKHTKNAGKISRVSWQHLSVKSILH